MSWHTKMVWAWVRGDGTLSFGNEEFARFRSSLDASLHLARHGYKPAYYWPSKGSGWCKPKP